MYMNMTVGLKVSEISRGQRTDGSSRNELDYNSLKQSII